MTLNKDNIKFLYLITLRACKVAFYVSSQGPIGLKGMLKHTVKILSWKSRINTTK